jgi:hypothetical protein
MVFGQSQRCERDFSLVCTRSHKSTVWDHVLHNIIVSFMVNLHYDMYELYTCKRVSYMHCINCPRVENSQTCLQFFIKLLFTSGYFTQENSDNYCCSIGSHTVKSASLSPIPWNFRPKLYNIYPKSETLFGAICRSSGLSLTWLYSDFLWLTCIIFNSNLIYVWRVIWPASSNNLVNSLDIFRFYRWLLLDQYHTHHRVGWFVGKGDGGGGDAM